MGEKTNAYHKIDYLEWARLHVGRVRLDLARSVAKPVTAEELGLTINDVQLDNPLEGGNEEIKKLLARRYGVDPAAVFTTCGGTMGLFLVVSALLKRGNEVLLEAPNYEPLYRLAMRAEAIVKIIDRNPQSNFSFDLEEIERKISRNTRAVMLTNLHNPSGKAVDPERLQTIGQIARDHRAYVIAGEVYLDNAFDPSHKPVATYGPNMISVGSLSKVYGLPGLRFGWIVAPEEVVAKVERVCDYVMGARSVPTESIALAALRQSQKLLDRSREIVKRNFQVVKEWAAGRPETAWLDPDGGTVGMLKLPPNVDASALSKHLREKYSTLVVPSDFFWIKGYVRVSCGIDEKDLRAGLENIGRALDDLKRSWR